MAHQSLIIKNQNEQSLIKKHDNDIKIKRSSRLEQPIIHLVGGHEEKEIFCAQFNSTGNIIASAGFDKNIVLWNVYGEISNYGKLSGHKGAILDLQWSADNSKIITGSSDKTVGVFDIESGSLIKRFKGHQSVVNSISFINKFSTDGIIASVSDDHHLKIWDLRQKEAIYDLDLELPLTSVKFSKTGDSLFIASFDESIKVLDFTTKKINYELIGHEEAVTGMDISNDGNMLLSYSMDNTLRLWDIKPFSVNEDRNLIIFEGVPHGFEKNLIKPSFDREDKMIATGCGDRTVMVFNINKKELIYKLPGHNGTVNQVHFSPIDNVILSASSDSSLFLGEL
ncbi:WD40 repeat-like protein [Neoconidiobolus thromboides FSU 785]|nr:WD40 repeat-like protein [Neoconidiobolus thromboides FSU 785]